MMFNAPILRDATSSVNVIGKPEFDICTQYEESDSNLSSNSYLSSIIFLPNPYGEDSITDSDSSSTENIAFELKDDLGADPTADFANHPICSASSTEDTDSEGTLTDSSSISSSEDDQFVQVALALANIASAKYRGPTILKHGGVTYTLHGVLGRGGYGEVVYALTDLGEQVAVKICSKSATTCSSSSLQQAIMSERNVLVKTAGSEQPFITQPLACFQDKENIYFVMRMYTQNLAQVIYSRSLHCHQIKIFAVELLMGLESLHHMGVVHRDIKPDNILITPNGHLAIADFGLARLFHRRDHTMRMFERCGTMGYLAPEILSNRLKTEGYTGAVDTWGYGMILYEMFLGRRCIDPADETQELLNRRLPDVIHKEIDRRVGRIDVLAADLLHQLFNRVGSERPSWTSIRRHAYFADIEWEAVESRKYNGDLPEVVLENLQPYRPCTVLGGKQFLVRDCDVNFSCSWDDPRHGSVIIA